MRTFSHAAAGWFPVDFIGIIGGLLGVVLTEYRVPVSCLMLVKVAKIQLFRRSLKESKEGKLRDHLHTRIQHIRVPRIFYDIFFLMFWFLASAHLLACKYLRQDTYMLPPEYPLLGYNMVYIGGFYLLARAQGGVHANTWISATRVYEEDLHVRYMRALYWVVSTMLTVGYGDVTAQRCGEGGDYSLMRVPLYSIEEL